MRLIKRTLLWAVGIIALLVALCFLTGNGHIPRGVWFTYLKGRSGPEIDDRDFFPSSAIPAPAPAPWPLHRDHGHRALTAAEEQVLQGNSTVGFVIIKNDSLLFEQYWNGWNKDSVSNSFSVAKSYVSVLTGIAMQEGRINDVFQKVGSFLPEFDDAECKKKIDLHHLLTMSTGLDWSESGADPFSDNAKGYYGYDVSDLARSQPCRDDPGVSFDYISGSTQIMVDVLEKAYGTSLADVDTAFSSAISGLSAGSLANDALNGGQDTDIMVRFRNADGFKASDVARVPVNAGGKILYLGDVASLKYGAGPVSIRRVDKQRSIVLGANLNNRPLNDVMQDVKKALAKEPLEDGITYKFRGQADQMGETFGQLFSALVLALILIYMLLAVLYESTITPFIRMFSLPLGIIGSVLLLFLTRNTLNLYSLIGILVMDGIVAKNGTLLLDYTLTLMDRGMSAFDAIIEAGRVRLKPIFMTTITMMVGMLPTALAMTEGAETRVSMAWVIIGGLLTSTVFTLIIIPIIFLFFEAHPPASWWAGLRHVFHRG